MVAHPDKGCRAAPTTIDVLIRFLDSVEESGLNTRGRHPGQGHLEKNHAGVRDAAFSAWLAIEKQRQPSHAPEKKQEPPYIWGYP